MAVVETLAIIKMKITLSVLFIVLTSNLTAQFFLELGKTRIQLTTQYYSIKCVESEYPDQLLGIHIDPFGQDSFPNFPSYIKGDTAIETPPYIGRKFYEDLMTGDLVYSNEFIRDSTLICDIFLGSIKTDSLTLLFEKYSESSFKSEPLSHCTLETIFITDTMNVSKTSPAEWSKLKMKIERLQSNDYFGLIATDCDENIESWETRTSGIIWKIE